MDINTITTLIGTLGFPILMCLILVWYIYKKDANHKEEINSIRESIDNNTKVMQELIQNLNTKNKPNTVQKTGQKESDK